MEVVPVVAETLAAPGRGGQHHSQAEVVGPNNITQRKGCCCSSALEMKIGRRSEDGQQS